MHKSIRLILFIPKVVSYLLYLQGVCAGVVVALIFELTLLVGSSLYPVALNALPLPSLDNCPVENITNIITSSTYSSTTPPTTTTAIALEYEYLNMIKLQ